MVTEYWYDENGNMRKDINKHIDSIRYNLLNLPEEIIFENGNRIKYYYDASGTKWRKVVSGSDTSTTDYVGNMMLENDTLKIIHTAEGRVVVSQEHRAGRLWSRRPCPIPALLHKTRQ